MKIRTFLLSASFIATLAIAGAFTLDTTGATLEYAPNCSTGVKKLNNDTGIKTFFSSGVFNDGNFYGCFTNPKEFQVKIYSISLVDSNGNESPLYTPSTPKYVNIINTRFNPVKDVSSLIDGTTYTKIKMVVDTNYKVKIDEQIATYGGGGSRVITYSDGGTPPNGVTIPHSNWVTPLTNAGVTGNGSGNVRAFFRRDQNTDASLITFLHNGFLASSSNMTLSNVGYVYGFSGTYGGTTYSSSYEQKDSTTGCIFDDVQGVHHAFCTPAEKALLTRYETGTALYPMQADWDTNASSNTISHITHAINLDANDNLLDYYAGGDENNSSNHRPDVMAQKATITLTLKTPFTYDASKGTVMRWKWLTDNLFFVGIWTTGLENGSSDAVSFIGLGPYSLDLSIKSVVKKSSGLSETTPVN